jgi:hypothetical protein
MRWVGEIAGAIAIGLFAGFVVHASNGGLPGPINLFVTFPTDVLAVAWGAGAAVLYLAGPWLERA